MKEYGIESNLKMVDDLMIKKFFPNYGAKNYLEVTEHMCEAWDKRYHNGEEFAKVWDALSYGYESSKEMVISKKAFTLLSKAQKCNAIIIVRDKKLAVYERDLRDMMDHNEEVAEWYATRPNQVDAPSISLERGEAPNGIRMIDGKEYFFDPAWNSWVECSFEESDGAEERFVSYSEYQEDYETQLYEMEDTVDEESD